MAEIGSPEMRESVVTDISSTSATNPLTIYIDFLAGYGKPNLNTTTHDQTYHFTPTTMAAIFDKSNSASPLAYNASQTALVLLDFQNFIIDRLGTSGPASVVKASEMRQWALKNHIMVIHSIIDPKQSPPATFKSVERVSQMLASLAEESAPAHEPAQIAFDKSAGEYIVFKRPGIVSGLKSNGAMELLKEHGIRSLIFCGLSTSGAVLRTTVSAADDEFVVTVIEDGCADPVQAVHEMLVEKVLPVQAHVTTAETFMDKWEGK